MAITLQKSQRRQALDSLGQFLREHLECDASDLQAGFLLDYKIVIGKWDAAKRDEARTH